MGKLKDFYENLRREAKANIDGILNAGKERGGVVVRTSMSPEDIENYVRGGDKKMFTNTIRKTNATPTKKKYGYKKRWRSSWAKDRKRQKNGQFKKDTEKC